MTLEVKAKERFKNKPVGFETKPELDIYVEGFLDCAEEIKADCDFALEGKDVEIKELRDNYELFKASAIPEIERLQKENNKLLDVINNQDVKIADLEKQMKKFDEGCNIIEELSKFINNCKWYSQHGYEEKQKELIEKVNNFFEGVEK